MQQRLLSARITGFLDEIGCHALSGQEYMLQHNFASFRFRVRKGDYDKGLMKLLIIQGMADEGYMRVEFISQPIDRQETANSTTHDYFTAKVSYR